MQEARVEMDGEGESGADMTAAPPQIRKAITTLSLQSLRTVLGLPRNVRIMGYRATIGNAPGVTFLLQGDGLPEECGTAPAEDTMRVTLWYRDHHGVELQDIKVEDR